jgi:hypothetical protein
MNRVAGIGHQHRVARVQNGKAEVRDSLFGANGHNRFGVEIEIDIVAGLVPIADCPAQARDAA